MLSIVRLFIGLSLLAVLGNLLFYSNSQSTSRNSFFGIFSKKKVLIYGATAYYSTPMWNENIIKDYCGQEIADYCSYTTDQFKAKDADAWLYHNRDFTPYHKKNWSSSHVHVMYTHESPTYDTILFKPNTINWTMTYRQDSDVPWPFGKMEKKTFDTTMNNDTIWNMKDENLTASWLVSHCKTVNRRIEVAEKIQKEGLGVDIFGLCGRLKLPGCARSARDRYNCASLTLKKYYFYFSFENSNCVDYVTEKFYNALRLFYAVPIVIKRDIYTKMGFPAKSFIALDDFKTIKEMVKFLNDLKKDKQRYLSYHEWRNNWEVKEDGGRQGMCELCRQLQSPSRRQNSYPDLAKWFTKGDCDNSYVSKYL